MELKSFLTPFIEQTLSTMPKEVMVEIAQLSPAEYSRQMDTFVEMAKVSTVANAETQAIIDGIIVLRDISPSHYDGLNHTIIKMAAAGSSIEDIIDYIISDIDYFSVIIDGIRDAKKLAISEIAREHIEEQNSRLDNFFDEVRSKLQNAMGVH